MNELQTIDNIKRCIATGKTKRAVDELIRLTQSTCTDSNAPALMLKSRIASLEREIVDGVVSHSDQKMEEARIVRALLSLVTDIEDECLPQLLESQRVEVLQKETELSQKEAEHKQSEQQNLERQQKEAERLKEELHCKEIERIKEEDQLKEDTHKREIERRKEVKNSKNSTDTHSKRYTKWLFLFFLLGTTSLALIYLSTKDKQTPIQEPAKRVKFLGKVQFPNRQIVPLAVVELAVQQKVFKATTDTNGKFEIELLATDTGKTVNLTIFHKEKAVISENIRATESIIKSLTIPFE